MSGFRVDPSPEFLKNCKKLEKSHYRKNKKGGQEFKETVKQIVLELSDDPYQIPKTRQERPPHDSLEPPWEFRKLVFDMPRLSGASGCGRVIFMVHPAEELVVLLCAYTHAEEEGRPAEKYLKHLLEQVAAEEESGAAERALDPESPPPLPSLNDPEEPKSS